MVLLWNMGYFDCASVCAGEVRNIGAVFPQVFFFILSFVAIIPFCDITLCYYIAT
jgi:hypothetical protein